MASHGFLAPQTQEDSDMLMSTDMSTATSVPVAASKASQACLPCRKQKRKCDKTLPACGLCSRMGRPCDYTDAQQAPSAEDLVVMQRKMAELEQRLNQKEQEMREHGLVSHVTLASDLASLADPGSISAAATFENTLNKDLPLWMPAKSKFPSAMFLDMDLFVHAGSPAPKPSVEIPLDVLEILSDANALQEAVAVYFNAIHCWMPIVSKKRMKMGQALLDPGPDLAMLFLAMKLVTSAPVSGVPSAANPVYIASKRFLALLESGGTISVPYLQAMLLVAIYEYGHAIYPAAWMTVGACVRYAEILGLPSYKESVTVLRQVATWTELEERRRVWWAVFVMDRVISIGSKRRPAAAEPSPNDILPIEDTIWDEGDVLRTRHSTVSAPITEPQGPFARLCQAALLISRVQSHIRDTAQRHRAQDATPFSVQDVCTLGDDITAFSSILSAEVAAASGAADATTASPSTRSPHNPSPQSSTPSSSSSTYLFSYPTPLATSPAPAWHSSTHPPAPHLSACASSSAPSTRLPGLLPAYFLSLSAHLLLYDQYSCIEHHLSPGGGGGVPGGGTGGCGTSSSLPPPAPNNLLAPAPSWAADLQRRAATGIRATALLARDAGVELLLEYAVLPAHLARLAPLPLDSLYAALATLRWLWDEAGEDGLAAALADVRQVLTRLDMRWRAAGEYLAMEKEASA